MSDFCLVSNIRVDFGGARLLDGHSAFSGTAARTTLTYFRVLHPPSRTHGVAGIRGFPLNLASIVRATIVHHRLGRTPDRDSAAFRPFLLILQDKLARFALPLRKFRSLAPPALGLVRPFPYRSAYGLKPWANLSYRFAANQTYLGFERLETKS